jgi:hypothetical protein
MTDRIRTLTLLERLRRHEMAAEARELGDLRSYVARLENTRTALLEKMRTEARIVTLEAAPYVGAYIRSVRNEEAQINRALTTVAPRIEELEHAMLERFREIATIRLASEQTKHVAQQARDLKETTQSDEQTLIRWVRRPRAARAGLSGVT